MSQVMMKNNVPYSIKKFGLAKLTCDMLWDIRIGYGCRSTVLSMSSSSLQQQVPEQLLAHVWLTKFRLWFWHFVDVSAILFLSWHIWRMYCFASIARPVDWRHCIWPWLECRCLIFPCTVSCCDVVNYRPVPTQHISYMVSQF